jgi:threonine synthase
MNKRMPAAAVPEAAEAQLRCCGCGSIQNEPQPDFRCSECGELLEVTYPAWEAVARGASAAEMKRVWRERRSSFSALDASGVWRYRELLPIVPEMEKVVTLAEGNTPLYAMPQTARRLGMRALLAKHQGMNPTGSFKDTGMTAAVSVAHARGYRWVVCASTGNTSASMAAYAAYAGLRALVLLPEGNIAWGKLSQALEYGAVTLQLRTDFDGCLRVAIELVRRMPICMLNSINPYRIEGQKTAAIEIMEQMDWDPPEHIIVPGGNLGNSSALGKGLLEMHRLGLIARLPKLSVIQAEGANPLYTAVHERGGRSLVPVKADTMATAIRIGNPASWRKAVKVLEATGGACEQVSEEEIALAKAEIGAEGLGCEPASAVTLAGLKKLLRSGFVAAEETAVLVLTGHVLKDPDYSMKFHAGQLFDRPKELAVELDRRRHPPIQVEAEVEKVMAVLERLQGEA